MKKERKINKVVEYFQWLDIKPTSSYQTAYGRFAQYMGLQKTKQLSDLVNNRANSEHEPDKLLYDLKNEDIDAAIAFTGAVDGNIIRNVCEWILNNKQSFGDTILEVGCDIGIISCFLAQEFPNSKIVAIDRFESGLKIAKQLAEELELKNIEFKCIDVKDLKGKFDTVFSCRTMHENRDVKEKFEIDFMKYASQFYDATLPYATVLAELVEDKGSLISIERTDKNPLFMGWLMALNERGLIFDLERYEELKCSELGEETLLQASILHSGTTKSLENLYLSFYSFYEEEIMVDDSVHSGWAALFMLNNMNLKFVQGYNAFSKSGIQAMQVALWQDLDNSEAIVYYINNVNTGRALHLLKSELLEGVLSSMQKDISNLKSQGYSITDLVN